VFTAEHIGILQRIDKTQARKKKKDSSAMQFWGKMQTNLTRSYKFNKAYDSEEMVKHANQLPFHEHYKFYTSLHKGITKYNKTIEELQPCHCVWDVERSCTESVYGLLVSIICVLEFTRKLIA